MTNSINQRCNYPKCKTTYIDTRFYYIKYELSWFVGGLYEQHLSNSGNDPGYRMKKCTDKNSKTIILMPFQVRIVRLASGDFYRHRILPTDKRY
jgi:hypothetical protein